MIKQTGKFAGVDPPKMASSVDLVSPMVSSVVLPHRDYPQSIIDANNSAKQPSSVKWTKVKDISDCRTIQIQPQPRHGHRAVAIGTCMIVFGGGNQGIMKDLYVFDTSLHKWYAPKVKGEVPEGSAAYGIALDGSRILVFGGMIDYGRYSSNLYELDVSTWVWRKLQPLPPRNGSPPCARFGHSFTIFSDHRLGPLVFLFGGLTDDGEGPSKMLPRHLNDLYTLQVKQNDSHGAWNIPTTYGTPPSPRESHTAVAYVSKDERFNKLIVYGGMSGCRLGDLHVLDVDTMMWCKPKTEGTIPAPRSLHTASIVGEKMYVFGGWVPMFVEELRTSEKLWKCSQSLACLNVENFTWESIQSDGMFGRDEDMPSPRAGHSAVVINNKIYIYSGRDGYRVAYNNQVCLKDLWKLDVDKPKGLPKVKLLKGGTNFLEVGWTPVPGADSYIIQCLVYENEKPVASASSLQSVPAGGNSVPSTPKSKIPVPESRLTSSMVLSALKAEPPVKDSKQKVTVPAHSKLVRFVEKPCERPCEQTQKANVTKWTFPSNSSGGTNNLPIPISRRPNITTKQILSLVGQSRDASSSVQQPAFVMPKPVAAIAPMTNMAQTSTSQHEVAQPSTFHGIQGMTGNKPGVISIPRSVAGSSGVRMMMIPSERANANTATRLGLTSAMKIVTPKSK